MSDEWKRSKKAKWKKVYFFLGERKQKKEIMLPENVLILALNLIFQ